MTLPSSDHDRWNLWTADIEQESQEFQHLYSKLKEYEHVPNCAELSTAGEALHILRQIVYENKAKLLPSDISAAVHQRHAEDEDRPASSGTSAPIPQWYSEDAGVSLLFTVVGNYPLGIWHPSEEILVSILGTPSRSTFYELCGERLEQRAPDIRTIAAKRDSQNMFELDIRGLKITLRYDQWPVRSLIAGDSKEIEAALEAGSQQLQDWHLTMKRAQAMSEQRYYQMYYYLVRSWTIQYGVYSHRLGYMDEYTLVVLTIAAMQSEDFQTWGGAESGNSSSFANNIRGLWKGFVQFCTHLETEISTIKTSSKVRAPHQLQRFDVAMRTLQHEATELRLWDDVSQVFAPLYEHFLRGFHYYIRIQLAYWSPHSYPERFIYRVERTLSVCNNRWGPEYNAPVDFRLWPERFVDDTEEQLGTSSCYLVGWYTKDSTGKSVDEALANFTATFERQLEAFGSFDPTLCSVHCEKVLPADVEHLRRDLRKYALHLITDQVKSADDSDDEVVRKKKVRDNANLISRPQAAPNASVSSSKKMPLRTALDVLNRIQHDPDYDVEEYIIGYHDRHEGAKEMPFIRWQGKDVSAEDFIPQHRIYYVRKRSGAKVWDRTTMTDLVFGSGNR